MLKWHKLCCVKKYNYGKISLGHATFSSLYIISIFVFLYLFACLLAYLLCIVKGKETLGIYLILSVLCLSEIGLEMRYNKGNENSKKKKSSR